MSENKFIPPPKKKTAIEDQKWQLTAPCPTAQGKTSSFAVRLNGNNPQIIVYSNDPEDRGDAYKYGEIKASLNPKVFATITQMIRKLVHEKEPNSYFIRNSNHVFFGGKRSERPELINSVIVAREQDGTISICLVDEKYKNRPKIKFSFGLDVYHEICKGDGSKLSRAELSQFVALGWCSYMDKMRCHLVADNYEEPQKKQQGGNNNYGKNAPGARYGNNNGGGNNQNYQQRQQPRSDAIPASIDSFDEEIPF
jgi:hypothetical protein